MTNDVIVVGSGIGGLACALSLAPRKVTLITKTPQLQGGSSLWAQGGIAAAVGPDDSPRAHAEDTLSAGAGLSHPERTRALTEEGAASLKWLLDEGIPFDRNLNGTLALAKEGAHRFSRVVHAGGDATGYVLMPALVGRVRTMPSINVVQDSFAYDLVVRQGRVQGLLACSRDAGWVFHQAANVVLATGGIGMTWWQTTNPVEATGDGLAMAARAGARLSDLEFMQFHPTALAIASERGASLPLLTEALRGAGALLLDAAGNRFMQTEHTLGELAPRDVVARAIDKRAQNGQRSFLDLRPVLRGETVNAFPQAVRTAIAAGFDPRQQALPVTPAAHYHMGGVAVDELGRTSVNGLWACGEVATTGIHGANRLASNSLLEAIVYARRIANTLRSEQAPDLELDDSSPLVPRIPSSGTRSDLDAIVAAARKIMTNHVAISRRRVELDPACAQLLQLERQLGELQASTNPNAAPSAETVRRFGEARNLLLVARLVSIAASRREESRGAHYRDDFPRPRPEWRRQLSMTANVLLESH